MNTSTPSRRSTAVLKVDERRGRGREGRGGEGKGREGRGGEGRGGEGKGGCVLWVGGQLSRGGAVFVCAV